MELTFRCLINMHYNIKRYYYEDTGDWLCGSLLDDGYEVVAVDNLLTGVQRNVAPYMSNPLFSFYCMGIETEEFVSAFIRRGIKKFDAIYHLACPTGVPNIQTLGEEMVDACSIGTKNVLRLAALQSAQVLYVSSSEVYGNPTVEPQSEEYTGNVDPQGWRANYEEGKRFSETLVSLFVNKYDLHACTVRLFNVYGPNMSLTDLRVVPRFVLQALSDNPITIYGDGLQTRTFCYVSDLVNALKIVMMNSTKGAIYNIGCDEKLSMRDLAGAIIRLTKSRSRLISVPHVAPDHDSRLPELSKIRELGWRQIVPLEEGLARTIEYFKHAVCDMEVSRVRHYKQVAL
jgi:nucleoside-diphosphate-sugar epimerase